MKTLIVASFALLFSLSSVFAQESIPERLLISTGQYLGPGARGLGMGGTYTGIADDYSAIWYNPAGLAQVKRIEVQGSLVRSGFSNDANYFGLSHDGSTSAFRLNNLGMVFPVPVYQGAFSFAIGYNQLIDYDRRTRAHLTPTSGVPYSFDELENGRLGIWTLAMATDVSPNLALGGGINYWNGLDEYSYSEYEPDFGGQKVHEETISTDLGGWNFGFGGLFRAGQFVRIGVLVQTPFSILIKDDWTDGDSSGYINYRMTYPAIFRSGISVAPGRWLLATDIEYRDWTTMNFRTDPPYDSPDITRAEANKQIKDTYKSTTRVSFGGEYLFPGYGLRGRAGYSFEPSNFSVLGNDANKGAITLGMGILIDRSVMLDVTYRMTSYTEKFTPGLSEDIKSSTALFTISYRM